MGNCVILESKKIIDENIKKLEQLFVMEREIEELKKENEQLKEELASADNHSRDTIISLKKQLSSLSGSISRSNT